MNASRRDRDNERGYCVVKNGRIQSSHGALSYARVVADKTAAAMMLSGGFYVEIYRALDPELRFVPGPVPENAERVYLTTQFGECCISCEHLLDNCQCEASS